MLQEITCQRLSKDQGFLIVGHTSTECEKGDKCNGVGAQAPGKVTGSRLLRHCDMLEGSRAVLLGIHLWREIEEFIPFANSGLDSMTFEAELHHPCHSRADGGRDLCAKGMKLSRRRQIRKRGPALIQGSPTKA